MAHTAFIQNLANPGIEGGLTQFHLTRQQLRYRQVRFGENTGLHESSFDIPVGELTPEERLKRMRENHERMLRALLERSDKLGLEIDDYIQQIDRKIYHLEDLLETEQAKTPPNDKRIEKLEEDIDAFKEQREVLEDIDEQRMNSNSEPELRQAENRFSLFKDRFDRFMDKMRKRDLSTNLRSNTDGNKITDALDSDGKPKPKKTATSASKPKAENNSDETSKPDNEDEDPEDKPASEAHQNKDDQKPEPS